MSWQYWPAADGILAINFEIDAFEVVPLHRGMARKFGLDVGWFQTEEGPDCFHPVSWTLYSKDPNFLKAPVGSQLLESPCGESIDLAMARQWQVGIGVERRQLELDEQLTCAGIDGLYLGAVSAQPQSRITLPDVGRHH